MIFILPEESFYAIQRIASQIRLLSTLVEHSRNGQIAIDSEALDDTLYVLHIGLTAALKTASLGRH